MGRAASRAAVALSPKARRCRPKTVLFKDQGEDHREITNVMARSVMATGTSTRRASVRLAGSRKMIPPSHAPGLANTAPRKRARTVPVVLQPAQSPRRASGHLKKWAIAMGEGPKMPGLAVGSSNENRRVHKQMDRRDRSLTSKHSVPGVRIMEKKPRNRDEDGNGASCAPSGRVLRSPLADISKTS